MQAVIVLGPFRGGTSLTTGIVRTLGTFVGECFLDAATGYSTYEAVRLREQCLKCFDERECHWGYLDTFPNRVEHLRQWYQWAVDRIDQQDEITVGGKHPTMCMLVDELAEAWRDEHGNPPWFLSVQRSPEDVIRSWRSAKTPLGSLWWPRGDIEEIVYDLIRTRDQKLARHPHLAINFDQLRSQPRETIESIARTCELDQSRIDDAVALVKH
ncbi:MAG: hypothetical protein MI861_02415 [Pirellulales bacterium]|nr:hypothetical protein [Pirellulales bacterium]